MVLLKPCVTYWYGVREKIFTFQYGATKTQNKLDDKNIYLDIYIPIWCY